MSKGQGRQPGVSRRTFLQHAVTGAGATAAAAVGATAVAAEADVATPAIRIPAEFAAARTATLPAIDFPMTGAQVFARACKEEGVAALFCLPRQLPGHPRHRRRPAFRPTAAATKGRWRTPPTRSSASPARSPSASGTEGPGFTDMICAIACANAARTPLLVVASNMSIGQEDTEAGIQLGYQQPTTEGLKKYGKRLIIPRRVHEYAGYAFRQLKSGVPKPVHLDFPAEVASARFKDASELEFFHDKSRYRTDSRPHPVAEGHRQGAST